MLDTDDGGQSPSGDGSADAGPRAPSPLREVIERIDRAVGGLAAGADGREAMHTVRSGLSDICALTEEDPRILRAVERVVSAGDRLVDATATSLHPRRSGRPPARLNAARRALAQLDGALSRARPSGIAKSLGRGW